MTLAQKKNPVLTEDEFCEMVALKNAMNYDISQVIPEKMEVFTEYFVRSLKQRGN